jgi:hypothetical protein
MSLTFLAYNFRRVFNALPNVTLRRELASLKAELHERKPITAFDTELFRRAVAVVTLNLYGELALTLRNGAMLTENEIQETEIGESTYAQQLT